MTELLNSLAARWLEEACATQQHGQSKESGRGPQGPNFGRSRCHQLSRALQGGQHHAEELRRIRLRVDHETTTAEVSAEAGPGWCVSVESIAVEREE
jgi:hypothetical protein